MTALALSENRRFRLAYRPTLDMALLFAAGLHLAAFILVPRFVPPPVAPIEEEVFLIPNVASNVVVPLPPVKIPRPPLPITPDFQEVIVSNDVDPEETIADTEIDIMNLTVPPPSTTAGTTPERPSSSLTATCPASRGWSVPSTPTSLGRPGSRGRSTRRRSSTRRVG